MKNLYWFIPALAFFAFAQCTPKTTETVVDTVEEAVVTKVDDVNAWRSNTPAPGPARKIQMGDYNTFTLDNGLQVIVVENNKVPKVSYSISLKHNPEIEGKQKGFVSMAGDMLSRGTTTKSKGEIDEAVDFLGATMRSSSNGLFASSLKKHSTALLDIVTDVLYNASFPAEEFEKVKNQMISGIQTEKSDPNSMASNLSSVLNYGKVHPYGEVTTEASVGEAKLEACKRYYKDYFVPNNAYLTIVGDISMEEAKRTAESYFGNWAKNDVPSNEYGNMGMPDATNVHFVNKDGAVQSVINITYPVDLEPASQEAIAANLTNSILGGGIFLGRLMQNLREDKAFTYGARSRINADDLVGDFVAFASVRNEVTDSSIVEFLYEMNRMMKEEVTEDDLQLAKNSATGSFARSLESPQTLARFARNIVKYDLPEDYYETYLEKIEAVTVADVKNIAEKFIRPDRANIVVVGNKDEVAAKLLKFDTDGKIDYYDPFGNIIEIDDIPLPANFTGTSVVEDYLAAIGGVDILNKVNSIKSSYTMSMMGQDATVTSMVKDRMKAAVKVEMNGMVVQDQRYDGVKALVSGMGQAEVIEEGPVLDQMKSQTAIFGQLDYFGEGYSLELKGSDKIDGVDVYKVEVMDPDGKKTNEYYAKDSKFLIRSVSTDTETGKSIMTTMTEYSEVDGIFVPGQITTEGAAPFPLVMKSAGTEINPDLSDDLFKVE